MRTTAPKVSAALAYVTHEVPARALLELAQKKERAKGDSNMYVNLSHAWLGEGLHYHFGKLQDTLRASDPEFAKVSPLLFLSDFDYEKYEQYLWISSAVRNL